MDFELELQKVRNGLYTAVDGKLKAGSWEQLYAVMPPVLVPSVSAFATALAGPCWEPSVGNTVCEMAARIADGVRVDINQFAHALESLRVKIFHPCMNVPMTAEARAAFDHHTAPSGREQVGTPAFAQNEVCGMIYMTELLLRATGRLPKDQPLCVVVAHGCCFVPPPALCSAVVPGAASPSIRWLTSSAETAATPVHIYVTKQSFVATTQSSSSSGGKVISYEEDANMLLDLGRDSRPVWPGWPGLAVHIQVHEECHRASVAFHRTNVSAQEYAETRERECKRKK